MTKKQIIQMYRNWRKANGNQKPNRVIVKMAWEDDDNTDKGYQVDTIAIQKYDCDNYPGDDCWLLYYVTSLKGLLSLLKPNNGSDFVVEEVLEFYKR